MGSSGSGGCGGRSGPLPHGAFPQGGVRSLPPVSISLCVFSCLFGTKACFVTCTVPYEGNLSVARWNPTLIYLTNTYIAFTMSQIII